VAKATDHPILDGVPDRFEIEDEPYIHEMFDADVTPLILREPAFSADGFQSACHAVRRVPEGERGDWTPPPPSPVIGWTKAAGNSRLVYLQPGDGPSTYAHPAYRRLVGNALRWVAAKDVA
jgi:type 1 glutamine amidotransferase